MEVKENLIAQWTLFFRKIGYALAVLVVMGIIGVAGLVFYFSEDLPDHTQLKEYYPATTTRLYAGDGTLLQEYARQKRIFVPIHAMPRTLVNAFIAAEDRNFYYHAGIDIFSIIRASFQNFMNLVIKDNNVLVGASTITQQVAKNILLTRERTLTRKIKEAILAFRMSITYSKDRIMELYLNEIYLGAGAYGVAAAAMRYFNKSVDELTIEEAALLAALPKAPSVYDPRKNYVKARQRRNWVIKGMLEEDLITELEAQDALSSPIRLRAETKTQSVSAGFFTEEVRRWLDKQYGSDTLYEDGLVVRTTLDPTLQAIAEKAVRKGLISYDRRHGFHGVIDSISLDQDWVAALAAIERPAGIGDWKLAVVLQVGKDAVEIGFKDGTTGHINLTALKWAQQTEDGFWRTRSKVLSEGQIVAVEQLEEGKDAYGLRQVPKVNGALVAMDPHTGRVLAMVGGLTYENSQFNRATQAKRQPGSAFKPFVYLTALEKGYTPAMLLLDEPIEFETIKPKEEIEEDVEDVGFEVEEEIYGPALPDIPEIEIWAPQNYSGDFYGPTTMRIGLEKSRNVMTVRLGMILGMESVTESAQRFNINKTPERNMSTVLGAAETTLLNLTNAYSMIINGGKHMQPSLIERIQDRNGKTVYKRDKRICQGCAKQDDGDVVSIVPPIIPDEREQVTDRQSAYQMVSMLEGVVKRGTGIRAKVIGKPLAGKTGTTNNALDAWFVGFSPDLVVGVYVGFDKPRSLGERETGASSALPIFVEFMKDALNDKPAIPFRIPPNIKQVKIDSKTGFLPSNKTPDRDIILEAFKAGTEPTRVVLRGSNLPVVDSSDVVQDPDWFEDLEVMDDPVTRGTGGIY